jgi:hypothetical protein
MATPRPVLLFGCFAAADDPFAVALRHIDPCFGIAVYFRCPAAGVITCRRAVILAGLGDTVALLRFERRSWRRFLCQKQERSCSYHG